MPGSDYASKIEGEIAEIMRAPSPNPASKRRVKIRAVRHPERETRTSSDRPGTSPPMFYELEVGRASDGHRDLPWTRLIAEYRKESAARERGSESALRIELLVRHAPDDHSLRARVDWPNPEDLSGAMAFAKKLVEDGAAQHARVEARVERRSTRRGPVIYNLAVFDVE